MGKIVVRNRPCLNKECGSHDARQIYEDGTSFCFSCQSYFPKQEGDTDHLVVPRKKAIEAPAGISAKDVHELPIRPLKDRKISKEVMEYFGVRVSYSQETGEIDAHYYPYEKDSYKVRKVATKEFHWINKSPKLFGQTQFNGAGKRLIITEGEIDALSVAQASLDKYDKIYPVVSIPSATGTKALLENREWIRSFQEVVLWMDNDQAGHKAETEAVRLIGFDKVKLVKTPEEFKDANDVLKAGNSYKVLQFVFDAAPYTPAGIIKKDELWKAIVEYSNTPSIPYPDCIGGINEKVKGTRLGSISTFISGTSCGKSTIMREIMLHLKEVTESNIGVISLEEAPAETAVKLAGMQLRRNPAKEEIPLDSLKEGFDAVFGSDRFMLLDHQGSLKDDTVMDKLEYMALSGCKYIVIDHITILVSEGAGDLTGNEAIDKTMADLLKFVKRHNVWIGLVSHLRKTVGGTGKAFEEGKMPNLDDIKGSGSIKQISFDIIAFARNLMDADPVKRNTIEMAVLKCRHTGLTGHVKGAYYDYDTGRFKQLEDAPEFVEL